MSNQITAPVTIVRNQIVAPVTTAGRDAYQLAVLQGFVGTRSEWLESLVGPPGNNGARGNPPGLIYQRAANASVPSAGQFSVDVDIIPTFLRVNKTGPGLDDYSAVLSGISEGDLVNIAATVIGVSSPTLAKVSHVIEEGTYYEFGLTNVGGSLPNIGANAGIWFSKRGLDGSPGNPGEPGEPGAPGDAADIAAETDAAPERTSPADTDRLPVVVSGVLQWLSLSRLWTFIKAKIDAGLTWAGNHTFAGQLEASGQAASTANSLLTRLLGDTRYAVAEKKVSTAAISPTDTNLVNFTGLTGFTLEANSLYRINIYGTVTRSAKSFNIEFTTSQSVSGTSNGHCTLGTTGGRTNSGFPANLFRTEIAFDGSATATNQIVWGELWLRTGANAGTGALAGRHWNTSGTGLTFNSGFHCILTKIS